MAMISEVHRMSLSAVYSSLMYFQAAQFLANWPCTLQIYCHCRSSSIDSCLKDLLSLSDSTRPLDHWAIVLTTTVWTHQMGHEMVMPQHSLLRIASMNFTVLFCHLTLTWLTWKLGGRMRTSRSRQTTSWEKCFSTLTAQDSFCEGKDNLECQIL